MKIHIGTDHAGFDLKNKLVEYLKTKGYDVVDHGAFELDQNDDYPDFVKPVANAVSEDAGSRGIIIGGSGQGEAMCANRHQAVRCVVFYGGIVAKQAVDIHGRESDDLYEMVRIAREHNNANVLSLGARFVSDDEAFQAVDLFLETPFSNDERHVRRIQKWAETTV